MILDFAAVPQFDEDEFLLVQLVVQLVVGSVFGIVCAVMAPNRGRSGVGWFFIGFFLNCVGLIILLLIPDLKVEAAKQRRHEAETRKLRELLKKERQVADQRHQVHGQRLSVHDRALGVDTSPAELTDDSTAPPPLPLTGGSAPPARMWFYAVDGERHGPVTGGELRTLWLDEQVPDSALVWTDGMGDWRPIGEVGDSLGGEGG